MVPPNSPLLHPYGPPVHPIPGLQSAPLLPCPSCHGERRAAPAAAAPALPGFEPPHAWWRGGDRDLFPRRPPALSSDGATGWRRALRHCHCPSLDRGEATRGDGAVPWYHLAYDPPALPERRRADVSQPYDIPTDAPDGTNTAPRRASVPCSAPRDESALRRGCGDVDTLKPLHERLAFVEARCENLERQRHASTPVTDDSEARKEVTGSEARREVAGSEARREVTGSEARREVTGSEARAAEGSHLSQGVTLERLMQAVRRARERAQQYEATSPATHQVTP